MQNDSKVVYPTAQITPQSGTHLSSSTQHRWCDATGIPSGSTDGEEANAGMVMAAVRYCNTRDFGVSGVDAIG